ncbi:hypothetical protein CFS9_33470 [Flavobacterium sp. CFS9]|uniref:Secretion system C-terminal sorting domain-containing protein n=2 Tax=Flavobacterium sp. CFS9 TaxID=3143118 RepID=A0AAT9H5Q3_9FLAO
MSSAYSQQSVVVAGGNATGSGGSSSYSVGQISYVSLSGANESVLQGVQQPYEVTTLGNDDFKGIDLVMTAYPNPTVDVLTLVITKEEWKDLSYRLFDTTGKIVSENLKIAGSETSVPMQQLNHGIYFLTVNKGNKSIKTFKIIKK